MDYKKIYDICHNEDYMDESEVASYVHIVEQISKLKLDYYTVLDVGCSIGNGVLYFNKLKKECYGCDVSSVAVDMAVKRNLDVFQSSILNIKSTDNEFDMVTCTDVLEHIEERSISNAFNELIRVAKKYIVLKIAHIPETSDIWVNKLKNHEIHINNLHLSIFEYDKWKQFLNVDSVKNIYSEYFNPGYSILIYRKV